MHKRCERETGSFLSSPATSWGSTVSGRCRARASRILKEAQRASWKAYVSSINARTPLTDVFNKVRRIAGKYSAPPPPILLSAVADSKTVADPFAEHFASVSWKDPAAPRARHCQRMESLGIIFLPLEGSHIISPSLPPSCGLLCPSVMILLLVQTTFLMRFCVTCLTVLLTFY
ncbi:hypothetical protein E2C01_060629 [Portunus trituberculatus]|uniref:Uncharacterized protein n=1 Tax=Portunus trituberculatus TaxID=210409 RepID=A0A5B7H1Q1_PORTR|nr:hypothetical protein [Portunus trituberculatus]